LLQESLFIDKQIILQGEGSDETILQGADNGSRAYAEKRTILAYSKCTIEGFTITQFSGNVDENHNTMAILLEATFGATIRNCKINNHITGIYLSGATDNLIENNIFSNCGNGVLFASFFFETNRNLIINNNFNNNGLADETDDAGIKVIPNYNGNANRISGNDIYNNSMGINNQSSSIINAEKNWWGSTSGPRHTDNSGDLGDSIQGLVISEPFATSSNSIVELNRVKGVVFYDENENKIRDSNEDGLFGQKILLLPDSLVTFTDINGGYNFNLLDGNYTIQTFSRANWELTSDSDTFQLELPESPKEGYNFGYSPNSEAFDVHSSLSSARTRCGFTIPIWLHYQNTGSIKTDGKVKFLADDKATFICSSMSPTTSGDTLIWDLSNLRPFEGRTIRVEYEMPSADFLGDTVRFYQFTEAIANGSVMAQSIDTLESEIACSYDPNDKTATPFGILDEHYTLKNEPIEYRIRFQNTGTDTAFTVVVRDTIQAEFDLESFEIISSSHKMTTSIENKDRAIAFRFDNILLPDSIVDEVNSHGYIDFRIMPKSGLADETIVYNNAHIYFDFNDAIITNTTMNTLVDVLPVERPTGTKIEDISNLVSLFPNPSNGDEVFLRVANDLKGGYQFAIMDLTGRELSSGEANKQQAQQDFRINTSSMNKGLYLLQITHGKKRAVKKLLKQ
jgi:uncharacterized repeat protein (TIGR01451 family)